MVSRMLGVHTGGCVPQRIVWVDGRAKADETARRWVRHVKEHGTPPEGD